MSPCREPGGAVNSWRVPRPSDKADVLAGLRRAEPQIRAWGVSCLALFGSFARESARADSDVDLLVEFAPGRKTFDAFMALASLLEDLLQRRVELVTREALSHYLGPLILRGAGDVIRAA